mgnify:FL=1
MLSFSLTLEPISKPAPAVVSMSFRLSCALRRIIHLHSKNCFLLAAPYKVPPKAVVKSLYLLRDPDSFSISETVNSNQVRVLCDFTMLTLTSIFKISFVFDASCIKKKILSLYFKPFSHVTNYFQKQKASIFYFLMDSMPFSRKSRLFVLFQVASRTPSHPYALFQ